MKKFTTYFWIIGVLFIIFSFRSIFISGEIGRTWDWGLPYNYAQYERGLTSQLSVWWDRQNAGQPLSFTAELPYWVLLGAFYAIPSDIGPKIFIVLLFIISFISVYCITRKLFNFNPIISTFSGILYAFSPYSYSRLIAGHLTILLGYAVLPIAIYLLTKVFSSNTYQKKHLILLVLITPFLSVHLSIIIIFLFVYLLYIFYTLAKKQLCLRRHLVFIVLFITINLFWIEPFIYNTISGQGIRLRDSITVGDEAYQRYSAFLSVSQPLSKIFSFSITPGLDSEFLYPFDQFRIFGIISSILLWLMGLISIRFIFKDNLRQYLLPLYILFLIGIGIISGNNNILGQFFYSILYKFFKPIFAGFSNPLRFFPLVWLPASILIAFVIHKFSKNGTNKIILFVFGLILLINWYPWLVRPLTKPVLQNGSQPLSLIIKQSNNEDIKINNWLETKLSDSRVALLPPSFVSWIPDTSHILPWSSTYLSKAMYLQYPQHPLAQVLTPLLYSANPTNAFEDVLSLANVQYVIKPTYETYESYMPFIPETVNYKPYVDRNWDSQKNFSEVPVGLSTIHVYENSAFVPKIYIPKEIISIPTSDMYTMVSLAEVKGINSRSAFFFNGNTEGSRLLNQDSNLLFIKPTCQNCDIVRIAQNELRPIPTRLPGSMFYWRTIKREEQIIEAAGKNNSYVINLHFIIGTTKLEELKVLIYKKTDNEISADKASSLYLEHIQAIKPLFQQLLEKPYEHFSDFARYKQFLNQNIEDIQSIVRSTRNSAVSEDLQLSLDESYELLRITEQTMSEIFQGYQTYTFELEEKGKYLIYSKDNLNGQYDVRLDDGNDLSIQSTKSGIWKNIMEMEMDKGLHVLRVKIKEQENLFKGFGDEIQDEYIFSTSNSEITNKGIVIKGLSDKQKYGIRFEYYLNNKPVFLTLDQENDPVVDGVVKRKIRSTLTEKGQWSEYYEEFYPNFGSNKAIVRFQLPSQGLNVLTIKNIYIQPVVKYDFLIENNHLIDNKVNQKLSFQKVGPTKYVVSVDNVDNPFVLVFSENYNRDWKAYIVPNKWGNKLTNSISESIGYFNGDIQENIGSTSAIDMNQFENYFRKPIKETEHYRVNGYANAWQINENGTYKIIIEYTPQRWYEIALVVSLVSFLVLTIVFVILRLRNKLL